MRLEQNKISFRARNFMDLATFPLENMEIGKSSRMGYLRIEDQIALYNWKKLIVSSFIWKLGWKLCSWNFNLDIYKFSFLKTFHRISSKWTTKNRNVLIRNEKKMFFIQIMSPEIIEVMSHIIQCHLQQSVLRVAFLHFFRVID